MSRLAAVLASAALTLAAAPSLAAPTAAEGGCTATLSGAATGTFACSVAARPQGGIVRITLSADETVPGLAALGPFTLEVTPPIPNSSWTLAGTGVGGATLETAAGRYIASPAAGELGFSVEVAERMSNGAFLVNGTMKAVLVPAPGGRAQGEVRVQANF